MTISRYLLLILLICMTANVFAKSALIIVDMQNCFVAGDDPNVNSLPVAGGMDIVSGINAIQGQFDEVIATYDWHPEDHVSFAKSHEGANPFETIQIESSKGLMEQALWPVHCVQNTKGAELVADLETEYITKRIYKGDHMDIDSYSGFFDNARLGQTELDAYLKSKGITDIYVVGLAADFCVKFTSIDGAFLNYKTYFVEDLTKAVFPDQLEESTLKELRNEGVKIINSSEIFN